MNLQSEELQYSVAWFTPLPSPSRLVAGKWGHQRSAFWQGRFQLSKHCICASLLKILLDAARGFALHDLPSALAQPASAYPACCRLAKSLRHHCFPDVAFVSTASPTSDFICLAFVRQINVVNGYFLGYLIASTGEKCQMLFYFVVEMWSLFISSHALCTALPFHYPDSVGCVANMPNRPSTSSCSL